MEATLRIPIPCADEYRALTITHSSIIVAGEDLLCCQLSDGAVILALKSGVYYGLDAVGTYIWQLIQEPRVMADVIAAVLEEYDVDPDRSAQDLKRLFSELADNELIEVRNESIE